MDPPTESSVDTASTSKDLPTPNSEKESTQSEISDSVAPTEQKDESTAEDEDRTWVTGNDPSLVYLGKLGSGSGGSVHEVLPFFIHADQPRYEISIQERYPCYQSSSLIDKGLRKKDHPHQ